MGWESSACWLLSDRNVLSDREIRLYEFIEIFLGQPNGGKLLRKTVLVLPLDLEDFALFVLWLEFLEELRSCLSEHLFVWRSY